MLRKLLAAFTCGAGVLVFAGAYAQAQTVAPLSSATAPAAPDCAAKATEKKLAGAALNSFMKKCKRETAASACDVAATEKKLAGAARISFTKKCVEDALGK